MEVQKYLLNILKTKIDILYTYGKLVFIVPKTRVQSGSKCTHCFFSIHKSE